jgi:hypothetical protein
MVTTAESGRPPRGLVCDACGGWRWRVVYTRGRRDGVLQRLRVCQTCGGRTVTWERQIPDEARRAAQRRCREQ